MPWRLLAVAVLALLAVLVGRSLLGGARAVGVERAPTAVEHGATGAELVEPPSGSPTVRASLPAAAPAVDAPAPPAATAHHAEGSVVGIDASGEHHAGLDGELEFLVDGVSTRIDARGGRWRLYVPPAARAIEGGAGVLDGRPGRLVLPWRGVPLAGIEYELHVVYGGAWGLHVLDARTDAPLDDVRLVGGDTGGWNRQHPGERAGARVGPSPIHVSVPQGSPGLLATYFVGAPGYAWRRVEFDAGQSGERTVRLPLAGALRVEVRGLPPGTSPSLLAYPSRNGIGIFGPHGFGASVELGERREVTLEGLDVGTWTVKVGFGTLAPVGDGDLARAEVAVVAGETRDVVLVIEGNVPHERVEFSGWLDVHEAWPAVGPRASMHPSTAMPDGREELAVVLEPTSVAGRHTLRAEPLFPGLYVLRIESIGAVFDVDVPPGGTDHAHFVVPAPRRVHVDVVAAESGAPLEALVFCRRADESNRYVGSGWSSVGKPTSAGRATFDMPPGTLELVVQATDRLPIEQMVEDSGRDPLEVRIELTRITGVRIHFLDEGRLVPTDLRHEPTWRSARTGAMDGELPRTFYDYESGRPEPLELWLEPGRYTIEPAALPGYERPRSFAIDVPADGFVDHRIDLVRLP